MSGYSVVRSAGPHLAVSAASVNIEFADGSDEPGWHADWLRAHQPEVDAIRADLEARVVWPPEIALATYATELPEAWSWAAPGSPWAPDVIGRRGPFRLKVQLRTDRFSDGPHVDVEVALAAAPSSDAIAALTKALRGAVG